MQQINTVIFKSYSYIIYRIVYTQVKHEKYTA